MNTVKTSMTPVTAPERISVHTGGCKQAGRWLKQAATFMCERAGELAGRPVWLFSSGPIGSPPKPAEGKAVDVREIAGLVKIREHRVFAGKLERQGLNWAESLVTRAVRAPEGDFRDWAEIRTWAAHITQTLKSRRTANQRQRYVR